LSDPRNAVHFHYLGIGWHLDGNATDKDDRRIPPGDGSRIGGSRFALEFAQDVDRCGGQDRFA
jgi:hypothetical protein